MTRLPARATALVGRADAVLAACSGPPPVRGASAATSACSCSSGRGTRSPRSAPTTSARRGTGGCSPARRRSTSCGEQWWTSYQPVSYQVESRLGTRERVRGDGADLPRRRASTCGRRRGDQPHDRPGRPGHRLGRLVVRALRLPGPLHRRRLPPLRADARTTTSRTTRTPRPGADVRAGQPRRPRHRDASTSARRSPRYLKTCSRSASTASASTPPSTWPPTTSPRSSRELPDGTGIAQEVIRGSGEPITPEQYPGNGQVYEFAYGKDLRACSPARPDRALDLGTSSSLGAVRPTPSSSSTTTTPSATARRSATPTATCTRWPTCSCSPAATARRWSTRATRSPTATPGRRQDARRARARRHARTPAPRGLADGDWVCQHRWPQIAGMVGWRDVVGDAPRVDVWSEGDAVAFGRGERGFVVVNAGDEELRTELTTSLPDGDYCDVLSTDDCAPATVATARSRSPSRRARRRPGTSRTGPDADDAPPGRCSAGRRGGSGGVARPDGGVRRHRPCRRRRSAGRPTPAAARRPRERHRLGAEVGDDQDVPVRERDDVVAEPVQPLHAARAETLLATQLAAPSGRSRTSTRPRRAGRRARSDAHSAGCGSQVTPVGEKPKPASAAPTAAARGSRRGRARAPPVRNNVGSWRRSSSSEVWSGRPSSSPWYRYAEPGRPSISSDAAARPAQPERVVGLLVAGPMPFGRGRCSAQAEPRGVPHDVVVGQHPGGRRADRVRSRASEASIDRAQRRRRPSWVAR